MPGSAVTDGNWLTAGATAGVPMGRSERMDDYADPLNYLRGTGVSIDPALLSSQSSVGSWLRSDWDNFVKNYTPLLQQQLASLNDNTLVKRAISDSADSATNTAATTARNQARYGVGNLSPTQQTAMKKRMAFDNSLRTSTNVNNARLEQRDRNENTALALAQQGNAIKDMAMDNMLQSVGIASNRSMANRQAAQQAQQANQQTAATAATIIASIW